MKLPATALPFRTSDVDQCKRRLRWQVEIPSVVAGSVKHAHQNDSVLDRRVENQIVSNRIEAKAWREVFTAWAAFGICREHVAGCVDSVELTIGSRGIVLRDVNPDFNEIGFRARRSIDPCHPFRC